MNNRKYEIGDILEYASFTNYSKSIGYYIVYDIINTEEFPCKVFLINKDVGFNGFSERTNYIVIRKNSKLCRLLTQGMKYEDRGYI